MNPFNRKKRQRAKRSGVRDPKPLNWVRHEMPDGDVVWKVEPEPGKRHVNTHADASDFVARVMAGENPELNLQLEVDMSDKIKALMGDSHEVEDTTSAEDVEEQGYEDEEDSGPSEEDDEFGDQDDIEGEEED